MVPAKSARSRPALRPRNIGNPARLLLMAAALWHGSERPIGSGSRLAFDHMQVPGHDSPLDAFPISRLRETPKYHVDPRTRPPCRCKNNPEV